MKGFKLNYLFILLIISFAGNSQCYHSISSNSILKDSSNTTLLSFYLDLAKEKATNFEIAITVSTGIRGDDLYRVYCEKDSIKIKIYSYSYGIDSLTETIKTEYDGSINMKFKNISGKNFIDSLVTYNFFTLKNMDSTMKTTTDTLENGSIRINEFDVVNIACNKVDYNFEYIIGDITRRYQYEGLYSFYKLMPNKIEFQKATKLTNFFFNHIEQAK